MFRLVHPAIGDGLGVPAGTGGKIRPMIHGGKVDVAREEPLRRELEDFVDAVRQARAPGVTGRNGRDALALATRVAEKLETQLAETSHRDLAETSHRDTETQRFSS